MLKTNDIYVSVGKRLLTNGYYKGDIHAKKELIDYELKVYIINKINEIEGKYFAIEQNNDLTVIELLNILANKIPKEKHFEIIRPFIHYILQIVGNIQNYSVIWWSNDNGEFVDIPVITINEDGTWEKLVTHYDDLRKEDFVKIFSFVYDVFLNEFMIKQKVKIIS